MRQAAAIRLRFQGGAQAAIDDEQPDPIPPISRYIHSRPSSRYSQPCVPSHHHDSPSAPFQARYSPARLPTTTVTSAPNRMFTRCSLSLRLASADQRRNEDAHAQPCRCNPEDRKLQVPCACNLERQKSRQIEAVETAPDRHNHAPSCRRERSGPGTAAIATTKNLAVALCEGVRGLRATSKRRDRIVYVAASEVDTDDGSRESRQAQEQQRNACARPEQSAGRRSVSRGFIVRPVVGIGVRRFRPLGDG